MANFTKCMCNGAKSQIRDSEQLQKTVCAAICKQTQKSINSTGAG